MTRQFCREDTDRDSEIRQGTASAVPKIAMEEGGFSR